MKLDEKRKVIEVLLCTATTWQPLPFGCARALGYEASVNLRAWRLIDTKWRNGLSIMEAATEAAYRLIESSATLRNEWFGP